MDKKFIFSVGTAEEDKTLRKKLSKNYVGLIQRKL